MAAPRDLLQQSSALEAELVAGCRSGDGAGLDRFFRAYVRYVERVIMRVVGPTPRPRGFGSSDLRFEAIQSFGRYRGEASLKTWVTRIAVHVALHHLRTGVRRSVPLEVVPLANETLDPARSQEHALSDRQLAQRLHTLLDQIAPKKRVAFLLYTGWRVFDR